jgi:steroid delta-isomerase-like uncharacterized protein
MSPTDIVRDYFECWNRRDWERARSLTHSQYRFTGPDGREQSWEAALAEGQMYAAAFPDSRFEIKSLRSDGDFVTTEFVATGTHKGELMGIAPTNKKVSLPGCAVIELRDGKVHRERGYMDMMHMMTQLGVVKMPAAAKAR